MTATFETATLARLLKIMKGALATRGIIPQLAHITFRQTDDGVTMTGTDLDMELTLDVPGAEMHCPAFTLELVALQKFLSSADKGALVHVTAEPESEFYTLSHSVALDGITATLDGFKIDDMPSPVTPELFPTAVVMPETELRAALDLSQHAIGTDEIRYYLRGVYMHATDQSRHAVSFCATDGHRLALINTRHETGKERGPTLPWDMQCIIPDASVAVLLSAMSDKSESPVVIQWGETRATFAGDGFRLITKLIDGTFPYYTRVLPRSPDVRLDIDHAAIKKQTARLMKLGVINLALDPGAGEIRGVDNDNPKQRFSFAHDFGSDADIAEPFGLRAKYLQEAMGAALRLGDSCYMEKSKSAGDVMGIRPNTCAPFANAQFVLMPVSL